jgi:primosomal protein N' (replication factor Y)
VTVPLLVAVDAPLAAGDVAFTYAAPSALPPGTAVVAPLRTRLTLGYVLGPATEADRPLRPLIAALPEIPPLPADLIGIAQWMAERYLCSIGEALAAMLPPGLMGDARVHVTPAEGVTATRTLRTLGRRRHTLTGLRRALGPGAAATLQQWVAEGIIHLSAAFPPPQVRPVPSLRRIRLNVHPRLWSPSPDGARCLLLWGGEREGTYLAAVSDTVRRDRQVLALFASIAEAERFAARVREVLGFEVTLLHGNLPDAERLGRWLAIRQGQMAIVAGTRAAVFAPLAHLGLVVVDEEGDIGHREERVPRYHVREVARRRAAGIDLLLADEVLSLETYALRGRQGVEVLRPERADGAGGLPRVVIIDLRRRRDRTPRDGTPGGAPPAAVGALTPPLLSALQRVLREGGRALLFVHRKGYADLLVCEECGWSPRCARCEVALSYDVRDRVLRCRYCRDRSAAPSTCPRCGGRCFLPRGIGTQQVARLAREMRTVVFRLDADVAPTRVEAEAILRRFRGEGGILVATPLVLQADEPPRVDLVGIVLADASLQHPDYRAPERGLRTLWRVRALARSWCVVQTFTPDHPAVVALRRNDLRPFYREELRIRRAFHYPPFGEVLSVEVSGPEGPAQQAAASLAAAAGAGVEVLGPAPLRRGRQSRWQVMLRGTGRIPREGLAAWLRRRPPARVRVAVDVDP